MDQVAEMNRLGLPTEIAEFVESLAPGAGPWESLAGPVADLLERAKSEVRPPDMDMSTFIERQLRAFDSLPKRCRLPLTFPTPGDTASTDLLEHLKHLSQYLGGFVVSDYPAHLKASIVCRQFQLYSIAAVIPTPTAAIVSSKLLRSALESFVHLLNHEPVSRDDLSRIRGSIDLQRTSFESVISLELGWAFFGKNHRMTSATINQFRKVAENVPAVRPSLRRSQIRKALPFVDSLLYSLSFRNYATCLSEIRSKSSTFSQKDVERIIVKCSPGGPVLRFFRGKLLYRIFIGTYQLEQQVPRIEQWITETLDLIDAPTKPGLNLYGEWGMITSQRTSSEVFSSIDIPAAFGGKFVYAIRYPLGSA